MNSPTFSDRASFHERPEGRPVMYQSWQNLLFLHWRFDPAPIQRILPDGLTVDTYDGSAWVALVPFEMVRIRPVWAPSVPYISFFLELNLRTYAFDANGTPGVWFVSLSANRKVAVELGRRWFGLPYHWCQMSTGVDDAGTITYRCSRFSDSHRRTSVFQYQPTGTPEPAAPESLEFFLAERYILFSKNGRKGIATGQVHHAPYQVQPVEVHSWDTGIFEIDGLPAPVGPPDHALFSPGVDVEVFPLQWTDGGTARAQQQVGRAL